jgi:hypothetical protein|tara:strand:+ start:2670 stop:2942 length:273 start_codon:yes stop_codon:yes gene_type:complete
MKIKEILSYHINETLGMLEVEFTLEDYPEKINNLEVPEEEIESICDLYESKEWIDYDSEDSINIKGEINEEALYDGLEYYINNVDDELNL